MPIPRRSHRIATLVSLAALAGALIVPPCLAAEAGRTSGAWAYVLFSPGSRDISMSGSMEDVRHAKAFRSDSEGLLYVRDGGSGYVIRDAATLRRAQALFEPQKALGARQSELGSRQAALGQQQSRLGAQQAEIGHRQAASAPRENEAFARQQSELSRQQGELGRQQGELGRQQSDLGREQGRLGRIAEDQMHTLLGEAIRSGLAQRVE
jgi:bla regulator protein BlaR1